MAAFSHDRLASAMEDFIRSSPGRGKKFGSKPYPAARRPGLAALGDVFGMTQVRKHKPLFWVFLMIYHAAFLLLILGHERYRPFYVLGQAALWVVVATSVVSGVAYYRSYSRSVAS